MDAKEFHEKNPGVKLGEFVEEDVPVQGINYDPETKKVSIVTKLEKQKVMYIDAPKEKIRCKSGEHVFKSVDPHKGIFACTKCPYHRQVYPSTYEFRLTGDKVGILVHRITGKVI